jgi:release factor glutamine methyltransferase
MSSFSSFRSTSLGRSTEPTVAAPAVVAATTMSMIAAALRAAGCVFAEEEARLLIDQAATAGELADLVEQRVGGLPLEQVLGWAEFCELRIAVSPGIFVPRQRTELLARQALALAQQAALIPSTALPERTGPRAPIVVDLCCGSGAVGAVLAAALDRIELYAADIDPAAVRCARRNLPEAQVFEGDLYSPLPPDLRGRIDVLVANAPYVPTDAIDLLPPEARLHEPQVALDGGTDGLDVLRRVIFGAPEWLRPGGSLLVETSARQAPLTGESFSASGLLQQVITSPELEATIVVGTRPH